MWVMLMLPSMMPLCCASFCWCFAMCHMEVIDFIFSAHDPRESMSFFLMC